MRCRPAVRLTALAPLLTAVALLASGCGTAHPSRSSSSAAGPTTSAAGQTTSSRPLPQSSASGRELFTRDCGFCHSLSGHSSPKQEGGDLLGAHLRRPVLVQFTAEMPVKHRLSRADLNAVVDYVLAVQRRGGQG